MGAVVRRGAERVYKYLENHLMSSTKRWRGPIRHNSLCFYSVVGSGAREEGGGGGWEKPPPEAEMSPLNTLSVVVCPWPSDGKGGGNQGEKRGRGGPKKEGEALGGPGARKAMGGGIRGPPSPEVGGV